MNPFLFPGQSARRVWLALLAVGLLALRPVAAQPSGAQGEDFIHRIQSGDTLIQLATRYTLDANHWRTLQQHNQVADPQRLPIALELRIPFSLIPTQPATARVTHVSGTVQAGGRRLAVGDQLAENDEVRTGPDGFLSLTLSDGSELAVPPGSSLRLERLRRFQGAPLSDAVLQMAGGSVESQVAPERQGVGRFEVRTPVSITGVRGTRLRVHASPQGAQSEVLSGRAQVAGGDGRRAMLSEDQGTAVDASGTLLPVRALLAAPALGEPRRGGQGWQLDFPPVAGASRYLVTVSTDAAGLRQVSRQYYEQPPVSFASPGPGDYTVTVRALDGDGVAGRDASRPFEGQAVLLSGDGTPVRSGSGLFVSLQQ